MKNTLIGVIVGALIVYLISLVTLPVLSLKFIGLALLAIVFAIIVIVVGYLTQLKKKGSDHISENASHLPGKIGGGILVLLVVYIVIVSFATSGIFSASVKQKKCLKSMKLYLMNLFQMWIWII